MKTEHVVQERRRELNRLAAQKLRNRQKERALTIRQEYFNAQSNNTRLVYEKKQLFKEKETLRMNLEAHLQFCQQQRTNILIGNQVYCLASPMTAFSQPIFITSMDQGASDRVSIASSDCDSRNGVDDADTSHDTQSSVDECQESDGIHDVDNNLQTLEVVVHDENVEGEAAVTLVIAEEELVRQQSIKGEETDERLVESNELTIVNDERNEHDSSLHSYIPLMVLDMNDS
jgi:hypothetical protein